MKIIVTLLLIFTIFTDFTSASIHNEELSSCETQISCESVDFHSSSDSQDHDSEEGHDHCHLGHSHNVIVNSGVIETAPVIDKLFVSYPAFQVGQPINYHLDINRPPIA